jgi:hypothetical protein
MTSLLISTPCYGKVIGEGYVHSLLGTMALLAKKGHTVKLSTVGNESLITRARNNQVAYFLSTKFDRLMFIDADITWAPQAVLDLLESDHDVCGTPYPTKGRDWERAVNFAKKRIADGKELKASDLMTSTLRFTLNRTPGENKGKDGWQEVDALATGFLMMKRHVLESMRDRFRDELNYKNDVSGYSNSAPPEHCVGLFETMIDPETRRYLSEDYAFCKRWIGMGGKVHAYLKNRLIHSGTADF